MRTESSTPNNENLPDKARTENQAGIENPKQNPNPVKSNLKHAFHFNGGILLEAAKKFKSPGQDKGDESINWVQGHLSSANDSLRPDMNQNISDYESSIW